MSGTTPLVTQSQQAFEVRLMSAAVSAAARNGFTFAPDCYQFTQDMVVTGVQRLFEEGRISDSRSLAQAEANLTVFVEEMTDVARTMGLPRLHEPTFFRAQQKLCPLWPFC